MTKYRPSNKLDTEDMREIAYLINGGIPRSVLAKEYEVSNPRIQQLAQRRTEWITPALSTTKSEGFRFAQEVYNTVLTDKGRRIVDKYLFRNIVLKAIPSLDTDRVGGRNLLSAVFGRAFDVEKEKEKISLLADYGVEILRANVSAGKFYASPSDTQEDLELGINEMLESSLSTEERNNRASFRFQIDEVLETLTFREREVIKMRYGFENGYTYTLNEISKIFKVTREKVRYIEVKAIRKLQKPQRASKLEHLLEKGI